MLTSPSHLLVLQVPGNGFQDYSFHHTPRYQGDADQPVVLQILFLEDRSDICLFLGLFSKPYSLSKQFPGKKSLQVTFISQFHIFSSCLVFLTLPLVEL